MRENFKSGSVRGLIVTSELILQYEVDYEPYLTVKDDGTIDGYTNVNWDQAISKFNSVAHDKCSPPIDFIHEVVDCKTRKAFTNNSCRGCIMGYATKERLGIGGRNV
uniref:Uncharacterized protein n=1 Tax=Candidatus Methanophagaceae archaeon ANME-1 ERB6 TaxID=2759912 RepID=A0A7G9Z173_9EURY|nr:hypothetical protein OHMBFCMF_00026 [Methanosarcinales archaeon ANME-1 ERB6]